MSPKKAIQKSFVMVGSGNLATHLCAALIKNNFIPKQVYSRTKKNAATLAKKHKIDFTSDLKKINKDADIYFICVKDDKIKSIASLLPAKNKLIIHCSGATSINTLKNSSTRFAVLYPLFTFSKNDTSNFIEIPIFIEGNNSRSEKDVFLVAKQLSHTVVKMNSGKREKLHLAAVMAANFSNFLFTLSQDYLQKEKAGKFEYLAPLLKKTIFKATKYSPLQSQTGPSRRHDTAVIKKHRSLLKKYPKQKKVYNLLSSLLEKQYAK